MFWTTMSYEYHHQHLCQTLGKAFLQNPFSNLSWCLNTQCDRGFKEYLFLTRHKKQGTLKLSAFYVNMTVNWSGHHKAEPIKSWTWNLHTLCQKLYIPCQHLHRISIHTSHPSNTSYWYQLVDQKISLSSWAAKYARIYEYQKPSQISKITMKRRLLFKCHCNEIYFVFSQNSLFFFDISMTAKIQCPVTYHLLVPFQKVS